MNIDDLKAVCQAEKLKTNKGLVLMNRKVSIYVTRFFIGLNVQADMVTAAGILSGVTGSLLFVFGEWRCNLIGISLLYVSFLFDQVDGELARYYKKVSLSGVYLDEIRHLLIYGLTLFCLSFPCARDLHSRLPYLLGFFGALGLIVARVEERLPKLIFTEKVLLRENYAGGELFDVQRVSEERAAGPRKMPVLKVVTAIVYGTADLLSHQVNILLWLLAVTLADRYVLCGARILGLFSAQTLVFMLCAVACSLATLGAIIGNYRSRRVDVECRMIRARSHE